jgi:hypothetical protein
MLKQESRKSYLCHVCYIFRRDWVSHSSAPAGKVVPRFPGSTADWFFLPLLTGVFVFIRSPFEVVVIASFAFDAVYCEKHKLFEICSAVYRTGTAWVIGLEAVKIS